MGNFRIKLNNVRDIALKKTGEGATAIGAYVTGAAAAKRGVFNTFSRTPTGSPTGSPAPPDNTEILMVIYRDKGVPTLMTTKPRESLILDDDDLNNLNNSTIPEKFKTINLLTDTIDKTQLKTINSSIDSVLKKKSKSIIGFGTSKSIVRNTKSLVGGKRIFRKTKTRKYKKI